MDYDGDNVGKVYNFLCDLYFDCVEALTFWKFGNVYKILKFMFVDNVPEDLLLNQSCTFERMN